jgi:hypothetical protein
MKYGHRQWGPTKFMGELYFKIMRYEQSFTKSYPYRQTPEYRTWMEMHGGCCFVWSTILQLKNGEREHALNFCNGEAPTDFIQDLLEEYRPRVTMVTWGNDIGVNLTSAEKFMDGLFEQRNESLHKRFFQHAVDGYHFRGVDGLSKIYGLALWNMKIKAGIRDDKLLKKLEMEIAA